jgi:hypothetical protein
MKQITQTDEPSKVNGAQSVPATDKGSESPPPTEQPANAALGGSVGETPLPAAQDEAPSSGALPHAPMKSPPPDSGSGNGGYVAKARSFSRFRLPQNFEEVAGVSKVLVHVSREKPRPQAWFRVHPDEAYRMIVALIVLKDEKSEPYLLAPEIVAEAAAEYTRHLLVTYVTRQGVVGLWPLRLPGSDGKTDPWLRSAHEGMNLATKRYVRMTANMSAGAYDVNVTQANLPEPEWPSETFEKLIEIAYRDHIIESLDHPVLRRLRGEV